MLPSERNLKKKISQYRLDFLVNSYSEIIRKLFKLEKPFIRQPFEKETLLTTKKGYVTITPWHLTDLMFFAINETSDFSYRIPSEYELFDLINDFHKLDDERTKEWILNQTDNDFSYNLGIGHSQKQFWYQELYRLKENFNRQVEILEVIVKDAKDSSCFDSICTDVLGLTIKDVRQVLILLFVQGLKNNNFTQLSTHPKTKRLNKFFTNEKVNEIINYYTYDYRDIRTNPLKEQALLVKPFIKTTSNNIINHNIFVLFRMLSDGPYWILRDYFRTRKYNDQEFINTFGELFELYFEKLLGYYFDNESFHKISRWGEPSADYILHLDEWMIIFELKSSLLPIAARSQYVDTRQYKSFIEKLAKGIIQLDHSAERYKTDKDVIKILVHFDELYVSDGFYRPLAIEFCRDKLRSKDNIFFSDITDIEYLFSIFSKDPALGNQIIQDKLNLEKDPQGLAKGREFSNLYKSKNVKTENCFQNNEINHYKSYFSNKGIEP